MPTVAPAAAEAPLVLALDLGTSSFRAILYDRQGRMLAGSEEQIRYALRTTPDGGAEAEAADLFDLVGACLDGSLRRAGSVAADVAAVGVASFWHGLLGLDAAGEPVTPVYYWADRRSAAQTDALRAELDQRAVHARVGTVLHSSYWPPKLRWLKETAPDHFGRVARWTSFPDYVARRLHGVDRTAVPMASGTGMLDLHRVAWDEELIAAVGLDRRTLPAIVSRRAPARGLRAPFAARWPVLADVPWYPPIGDGACANVGCGAVTPARVALTLGTSGALRVIVPNSPGEPLVVPRDLWAYRLDEERVVLGAAISNGGVVRTWLRDLMRTPNDDPAWAAAAALPPDGHGLTILPFLVGERSPIWNDRATAVVAGLTLHTEREHLLRAALEAVAYRLALLHDAIRPLAAPDHAIVASGGAVLGSRLWLRIIADALAHPVTPLPPDDEATARGVAILALEALGELPALDAVPDPAAGIPPVPPDPAAGAVYRRARARQARLEALLYPAGGSWEAG